MTIARKGKAMSIRISATTNGGTDVLASWVAETHISNAKELCRDVMNHHSQEYIWALEPNTLRIRATGWGADLSAGTLCVLERKDGHQRDITEQYLRDWNSQDAIAW